MNSIKISLITAALILGMLTMFNFTARDYINGTSSCKAYNISAKRL